MKRMWSKNELKNIADTQAKAVQKNINTLVDAQGHQRFIEGNITTEEITGITFSYAKWSLSGTHLMIVLAGKIDANSSVGLQNLALVDIPQWLKDKLIPSGDNENIISAKECEMWLDSVTPVSSKIYCGLQKAYGNIYIATWNDPSWSNANDVYFRIAFDLLVDNA